MLYAGLQDVRLLEQVIDAPRRLLDTQVAWAMLGPEYSASLAYCSGQVCGIRADKGRQADDLGSAPPSPAPSSTTPPKTSRTSPPSTVTSAGGSKRSLADELAVVASLAKLSPEPEPPQQRPVWAASANAWQLSPEGLVCSGPAHRVLKQRRAARRAEFSSGIRQWC